MRRLNAKHRKALAAAFARPTRAGFAFADLGARRVALGGERDDGAGSRVSITLRGERIHRHRPHPGKQAKRHQVAEASVFLMRLDITP